MGKRWLQACAGERHREGTLFRSTADLRAQFIRILMLEGTLQLIEAKERELQQYAMLALAWPGLTSRFAQSIYANCAQALAGLLYWLLVCRGYECKQGASLTESVVCVGA